jgi:alkylation response protein AidB-like acyl-CoA dehydrogenase
VAALQAKLFATVSAGNAARDAVQIHGAIGCSQDHAVSRYFRDAKVMEIIEGSTEIAEAMIGQFEQGRLIDSGR